MATVAASSSGRLDRTVDHDPFGYLERQRLRDVRLRVGRLEVESFGPAALAEDQSIGMPLRRQERRPRRRTCHNGVDGVGGSVDEDIAARQVVGQRFPPASAAAASELITPATGSEGTVAVLWRLRLPSGSATTRSVKVPPVSTAKRSLPLLKCFPRRFLPACLAMVYAVSLGTTIDP